MITSKGQLNNGTHVWVYYNKKILLGVILEGYCSGFSKTLNYKIIIPFEKDKCSIIVRAHDDKTIFDFENKEAAIAWLEQYDKTRKRKVKFVLKKFKLPKR